MRNYGYGNYFSKLAENASKTMKKEEVQALKNKLIKGGAIGTAVGGVMVFLGFILFVTSSFSAMDNFEFGMGFIVMPMIIFLLGGFVLSIGTLALKAGLAMVVGEKTADFLDQNIYCPKCNSSLSPDEKFCDNCGESILAKTTCLKCNTVNKLGAKFCKECGDEL